jgi:hypothetical protein
VKIQLIPFDTQGELVEAVANGICGIGLVGSDPDRAQKITFAPAYVEIKATYLVPPNSPLNAIEDNHKYHLLWAQDEERFETIITGIRATQVIEAMDLDKYTRYTTSFQNRIFKGIHGLAIVDQYEAKTVQVLPNSVNLDQDEDDGAIAA